MTIQSLRKFIKKTFSYIGIYKIQNSFSHPRSLKIIFYLRNLRIQTRLIIAFTIISLIPLTIIGLFSYCQYSNSIRNKLSKSSYQLLEQLDKNISTEIEKYENLCDQLSLDRLIQENLPHYSMLDDMKKGTIVKDLNELLGEKRLVNKYIDNISIYTDYGEQFYDLGYDSFSNDYIDKFTEGAKRNIPLDYWASARSRRDLDSIVICRSINSITDSSSRLGYMFISIDEQEFSKNAYDNVDMGKGSAVFIISEEGIVLSSIDSSIEKGKKYPDPKLFEYIQANQKENLYTFTLDLAGEQNQVLFIYNSRTKWYIAATILISYIDAEASMIKTRLIFLIILCLIFSVAFSLIITISIAVPIKNMVKTAGKISEGDLGVRIQDKYNDEMGYLSNKFDSMVKQMGELIKRTNEDQKKKRELELNMLQAQINPHFLFNTLNTLKWTALMSRVPTVSEGIGALANLLRNTIINKNELITLEEELINIENYLTIQKIRYADSFNVIYDIEECAKNNFIIKFILQPIVENAIIHGVSENKRQINIKISTHSFDEYFEIEICDDGKGFDLSAVNGRDTVFGDNEGRLSGIGINNVRDRIILHFGDKYGQTIKSSIGEGTQVVMRLPVIKKPGDEAC
ncbi:MAG: sensor histidine kinase [Clostridiaceae bacterium]